MPDNSKIRENRLIQSPVQLREVKGKVTSGAPSFAADIRPLFRDSDISAMKPIGIDLSFYEDVRKRAQDIYARLSSKEMPCGEPWSDNRVRKLKEWMESGMAP